MRNRKSAHANAPNVNPKVTISQKTTGQQRFLYAHRYQVLIISVLTFLLYANTLTHDYVLDDKAIISQNPITQQGIHGIGQLLTHPQYFGAIDKQTRLYRPVPMMTHAIEYEIFGMNPHAAHLINVILYVLLCVLIYRMFCLWFEENHPALPFLAALLFMAHPIHTEVVANIKGRDEILVLIFCCCSIIFSFRFIREKLIRSLIFSILLFGLALFSKEDALPFLVIIPLTLFYFSKAGRKRILYVSASMVVITLAYVYARSCVFEGASPYHFFRSYFHYTASRSDGLATAMGTFSDYFRLLIFPHPLVWSYTWNQIPLISWVNWKALTSLALLFFLTVYGLILLPKKNLVSFCILSFLLSWSIVSNILFPISAVFAERFMFIPSLPFVIALAYFILKLSGLQNGNIFPVRSDLSAAGVICLAVFSLIFIGYSLKTVSRNSAWKDDFTLFSHDIRYQPENVLANFFLGGEYVRKSIHAVQPEKKVLEDKALYYLSCTSTIDSGFYEGYFLSGILLFHQDRFQEAITKFSLALRINPDFPDTVYSAEKGYGYIATSWIRLNDYPAAIAAYQKLVGFEPSGRAPQQDALYAAYQNIGVLYNRMQQYPASVPYLQKALAVDSTSGITWQTLGFSYYKTAEYEQAVTCLLKSIEINPADARSCYYLSLAYTGLGKKSEAADFLHKASQMNPVYARTMQ
jgi:tetratricopeptide (TPR) repeat protein